MRNWISYAVGGLVVITVAITCIVLYRVFMVSPLLGVPITRVNRWRAYALSGERLYGSPNAPVTITEFSDLQCPFCRALSAQLQVMEARRGDDIRVIFRNYPLQIHQQARRAALGGICAALFGAFPKYHDAVFKGQDSLDVLSVVDFARRAGVDDTTSFITCVNGSEPAEILRRDTLAAHDLHVAVTPTYLVNEYLVQSSLTYSLLDSLVTIAKQKAEKGTR